MTEAFLPQKRANVGGEILAAIAAAMKQIKPVAKSGRNQHDRYDFASIDDFLAAVGPICAENGLIPYIEEEAVEDFTRRGRNGETAWMRVVFGITLWHTSGQSMPKVRRSVEVIRNGAQAYGSAQSYVLKQYLRALLQIPTGDQDDADLAPRAEDGTMTRDRSADSLRDRAISHVEATLAQHGRSLSEQAQRPGSGLTVEWATGWLGEVQAIDKLEARMESLRRRDREFADNPAILATYESMKAKLAAAGNAADTPFADETPR